MRWRRGLKASYIGPGGPGETEYAISTRMLSKKRSLIILFNNMSDSKQRDPARWLQWAEDWYYFYHERVRLRGLTCPWYELPFPPPRHGFDYPPVSVDQKELLRGWTVLVTVPVYVGFSKYLLDQGHIGFGVFAKERLRPNVTLNLYSGRAYLPTDQKDFCPDGAYGLDVQCLRPVECGLDREAHVEGHTFNVVSDPFRVSNANWTCLVNSPRECKAGDMVLVPERQNSTVWFQPNRLASVLFRSFGLSETSSPTWSSSGTMARPIGVKRSPSCLVVLLELSSKAVNPLVMSQSIGLTLVLSRIPLSVPLMSVSAFRSFICNAISINGKRK